jgi:Glycosyl transferase family 64 domain
MQLTARTHRAVEVHSDSSMEEGYTRSTQTPMNHHHPHRRPPQGHKITTTPVADLVKPFRRLLQKKGNSDPVLLLRSLISEWSQLSTCSKFTLLALLLVIIHILLTLWDLAFYQVGHLQPAASSPSTETSFAVAINTYRRPEMLRAAVQHYGETCGRAAGVSQVFIVWAEQTTEIPNADSFFDHRMGGNGLKNRASVHVLKKDKDSLNSRFEPITELASTAVFMVDDDLRVACPSLTQAFEAWKENQDSMVGYYPRLSSPPRRSYGNDRSNERIYHTWPVVFWKQSFNFVLTKACFLHSKYLDLYTDDNKYPKAIKDHVDKGKNCEDIAMSMLVANYTKYHTGTAARPIYVEGRVSDEGLIGGISAGPGHMTTRSECLTSLTSILNEQGWPSPLDYEVQLQTNAWIRHAPGFWWQYRPSNFFEWFAFANTFT